MTTLEEQNKSLVLLYLKEIWQKSNIAAVDDFLSPEYKRYVSPISEPLTLDGQKQRLTSFRAAFAHVKITVEDIFAEGERVAFDRECAARIKVSFKESNQRVEAWRFLCSM